MGDRDALLRRMCSRSRWATSSIAGSSRGLGVFPLHRPPLDLALDVPLAFGQIAEADVVDIDIVQIGEHVEEVLAGRAAVPSGSVSGPVGPVEHDAVDEAHHIERRAVDRRVGAQPERLRHRHVGRADGGDDAVLAGHVVCGGEHLGEWRAAQHESAAIGVGHREREVGSPTGDQREPNGDSAGDVVVEPGGDPSDVDALHDVTP